MIGIESAVHVVIHSVIHVTIHVVAQRETVWIEGMRLYLMLDLVLDVRLDAVLSVRISGGVTVLRSGKRMGILVDWMRV